MNFAEAVSALTALRDGGEMHIVQIGQVYVEVTDETTDDAIRSLATIISEVTTNTHTDAFIFTLSQAWPHVGSRADGQASVA